MHGCRRFTRSSLKFILHFSKFKLTTLMYELSVHMPSMQSFFFKYMFTSLITVRFVRCLVSGLLRSHYELLHPQASLLKGRNTSAGTRRGYRTFHCMPGMAPISLFLKQPRCSAKAAKTAIVMNDILYLDIWIS